MSKLGFIGFGEAAYNIASGLKGEGFEDIAAYDKFWNIEPQSDLIEKRAKETDVKLFPSIQALVENSDMILSAVSADMALSLAQEAKPFLDKGQIYVDLNATSPMTKEAVDSIISPVALFVDCAVSQAPTRWRRGLVVVYIGLERLFQIQKWYISLASRKSVVEHTPSYHQRSSRLF